MSEVTVHEGLGGAINWSENVISRVLAVIASVVRRDVRLVVSKIDRELSRSSCISLVTQLEPELLSLVAVLHEIKGVEFVLDGHALGLVDSEVSGGIGSESEQGEILGTSGMLGCELAASHLLKLLVIVSEADNLSLGLFKFLGLLVKGLDLVLAVGHSNLCSLEVDVGRILDGDSDTLIQARRDRAIKVGGVGVGALLPNATVLKTSH